MITKVYRLQIRAGLLHTGR